MTDITLDDDVLGGSVELKVSVPAELHAEPYYSVSQSEEGFEKIMQAVTLKLQWPVIVGELVVRWRSMQDKTSWRRHPPVVAADRSELHKRSSTGANK